MREKCSNIFKIFIALKEICITRRAVLRPPSAGRRCNSQCYNAKRDGAAQRAPPNAHEEM